VSKVIHHTTTVRVRYADTDKMGIVYNGNYLQYFEIGRTELLRSVGLPYTLLEEKGFLLPVLEAHVEYLQPARYDDVLEISTTYEQEHRPVITLQYVVSTNGTTLARGYTRHSFVSAESWKPVRPPALFQNAVSNASIE
jgi:acyl-CoA thioester hydrolase